MFRKPINSYSNWSKCRTLTKLQNFTTLINSFKAQLEKDTYELAESIAKTSGLLGELHKDKTPEGVSRYENIQELLNAIKEFSEKEENSENAEHLNISCKM